jgi:hypothetical protein
MGTFLQFLQLLIAVGPQLVPVWQQILAFVQAHRGNQPLPAPTVASPMLSPAEDAHLLTLHDMAVVKGGMAAAAFNLGTLIQVWRYLQAHPELMQAIESIIQAFIKPQQVGARKLGKNAAKFDRRTLHLASYLQPLALPQIPNHCTWSSKVPSWPMYDNDRIGDCAIAGPAHLVQCWTGNDGQYVIPSDHEVIAGYEKVGHYNPHDPSTDGGCVLLDVMNTWRRDGLFGNHKIGAYVAVTPAQHDHICAGIYLFGGLTIGLALPEAAQDMQVWKAPSRFHRYGPYAPGSWGGHCVVLVDYNETELTCVTWGGLKRMTWNFLSAYCDEAYAAISNDWLGPDGRAPNGFDTRALAADLAALN